MKSQRVPWLRGAQVSPPSAVWNTPAVEMPTQSCPASRGCGTMECRISPPPPGCHSARLGWSRRPRTCRHDPPRSEEHTSELQSLMRISYAVFCLKKKTEQTNRYNQYYYMYTQYNLNLL